MCRCENGSKILLSLIVYRIAMLSSRFILLLFFILCASIKIEAQIQVRVKFNEIANLTYQLDCVSDLQIPCSRSNLGELWNREFLKSNSDRLMLKEWARVRDRYQQEVEVSGGDGGEKLFLRACLETQF